MPAALGADHDVGVDADRDGLGVPCRVQHDLHVIEIGEDEFLGAFERAEAKATPEIEKTLLRVAIEPAIPLGSAKFDASADHLESNTRFAKLTANSKPLDLGEVGEITNAQTCDWLVPAVTEKMRRGKVIAVVLFVVRTLLLRDIYGAADRNDPHHVFQRARNRHRQLAFRRLSPIVVVNRHLVRLWSCAAINMDVHVY